MKILVTGSTLEEWRYRNDPSLGAWGYMYLIKSLSNIMKVLVAGST
jgi:hypothetical protein